MMMANLRRRIKKMHVEFIFCFYELILKSVECDTGNVFCKDTGGKCYNDGTEMKCLCPKGITYDAKFGCIDSVECDTGNVLCKDTGGKCYNEGTEIKCLCPKGITYHAKIGCIVLEEKCNASYPKCVSSGGQCIVIKDAINCICPDNVTYIEDTECIDLCLKKCGADPGVRCEGDRSSFESINCTCEVEEAQFIPGLQECKKPCDDSNNTCINGGSCESRDEKTFCECIKGTSGHFCEEIDVCKNNLFCGSKDVAQCIFDVDKERASCKCVNEALKFDNHTRKCRETCKNSDECQNGGICTEIEDYYFCDCKTGTSGHRCENIDICPICPEESVCKYDLVTMTAFCKCNETNAYHDMVNNICIQFDGCILKTINGECSKPNEECRNGTCDCKKGYKYSENNETCEVDRCATCPKGFDCEDSDSDDPCKCNDGYFDGKECIKYDKCALGRSKCNQKCDKPTGMCKCEKGFILLDSDNTTCEVDETLSCDLNCDPGSCIKRDNKQTCVCPEATHKIAKTKDSCIDLCTLNKGEPPSGLKCPDKCEANSVHGISCICKEPYEQAEDGIHCKRKEMCKEEKVIEECNKISALCKEVDGDKKGYECYCDKRFKKDENGVCKRKCDLEENNCLKKNAHCDLDEDFNVICRCPPLLAPNGKDGSCNEIAKFSYEGEISILKRKYIIEDGNKRRRRASTELYNSIELLKDLKDSLKTAYDSKNFKDVKIIDCKPDDNLLKCDIELQLNYKPEDANLLISPKKCNIIDEKFCLIENLVIKRDSKTIFEPTPPCIVKNTFCDESTDCVPSQGNFQCKCKNGFRATGSFNPVTNEGSLVERCVDKDECKEETDNCPKNSTYCQNTIGDYECHCKDGFKRIANSKGSNKNGCEAVCEPNPCENGGECEQKRNHEFMCRCKPLYTGYTCNETVTAKSVEKDHKSAAIVGGVLGTLLVITLILFVFFYRKMKKNKNYDSDDEYAQHRQRSVLAEITRLQNRERNQNEDVERDPNTTNKHARLQRENEGRMIPRAHTAKSRTEDQDRRDKRSESEMPRRMYGSKEDERPRNKMHFTNRAYDEEE